jgi:hypothetical protein
MFLVAAAPSFWNNVFDLTIGHCGKARQHVAQISVGLDIVTPAAFDDRVNDRAAFACIGVTEK